MRDPAIALRDNMAFQLRLKGWTYRRIGLELGISRARAHVIVRRVWEDKGEPYSQFFESGYQGRRG